MKTYHITLKLTKKQQTEIDKFIDKHHKPRKIFGLILIQPLSKFGSCPGDLKIGYMQSETRNGVAWLERLFAKVQKKIKETKVHG